MSDPHQQLSDEDALARQLGTEISTDPANPLLPIWQSVRYHYPDSDLSILRKAYKRAVIQHSHQQRGFSMTLLKIPSTPSMNAVLNLAILLRALLMG